ncbi:hypothetical protein MKA27_17585 [[Clostridium] innocuum]|uniref:hypothetical protein n=1 Tax=Clostridium innocuum TaxID=1522 RepID=UPI000D6D9AEE|nr:hypothetical protein [[Clostridium] innocuum]MCR0316338.1 hypothetical protein [[Clostridium] innocuum]MCR0370935.1 hypothetical protein [[Clostridium] innocuum]MCR0375611.1 hypothetical protein [[Clostridium] innocuum]MCR0560911.1 hypothetical protein [[Clostridium] innocuum]MCR0603685.1 hypothetical protein [[Clostridium] innocuum]
MKTASDKKVNRLVRGFNRQLHEDVFGDRFSLCQIRKSGYADCHVYHIYLYRFIDRKYPSRNYEKWFSEGEILISKKLYIEMNEFIVSSDFWDTFDKESYFKNKTICPECHTYVNYKVKKIRLRAIDSHSGKGVDFIGEQAYCKKCKSLINQYYTEDILKRNKKRIQDINENLAFDLIISNQ